MKLHGKAYVIPTFSKAPVVKDPLKENQKSSCEVSLSSQVSVISSSLTNEKDLKKNA